jgi:hypothetical protein
MRHDIFERRSCIEKWIAENRPKAFMCRELRCKQSTLNSYLARMQIKYAGNMGGKGYKYCPSRKKAQDYLRKGSLISSHKLRLKLIEDGVKERHCERCGNTEWFGEPIPVELHHVNGDRFDNRIENLQLLCPNCHALTDNHAGRGSARISTAASK